MSSSCFWKDNSDQDKHRLLIISCFHSFSTNSLHLQSLNLFFSATVRPPNFRVILENEFIVLNNDNMKSLGICSDFYSTLDGQYVVRSSTLVCPHIGSGQDTRVPSCMKPVKMSRDVTHFSLSGQINGGAIVWLSLYKVNVMSEWELAGLLQ